MMLWYYKLLALHPKWVAFVVFVLSCVCIFIAMTFEELPDFTDPALVSFFMFCINCLLNSNCLLN